MTEYTPTIQGVRDGYVWLVAEDIPVARDLAGEEFDRFLARVRRDAAREALDGLAEHIDLTASQFLGIRVGSQKAQDVRDYRDEHYPEETDR